MIEVSIQKIQGEGILTFAGKITSEHNDDFRSALMISLSGTKKVSVNFDNVSSFDKECINTFCAALTAAKKQKKDITYDARLLWEKVLGSGAAPAVSCEVCHKGICSVARQQMAA